MRYRVGDRALLRFGHYTCNGRNAYRVFKVLAVKNGSAISYEATGTTVIWSPVDRGGWLVLVNNQTTKVEKTFEEAKMVALYPEVLDRMANIDRHGKVRKP
jgi:hypothetical protein